MSPNPLRVLIVDDNRSAADAMARAIRKSGDTVQAVYDGATAISLIHEDPPDLVLTDLKMEPVDGLQVLYAARQQRPPVEVIVFTAYGAVEVAVRAMRLGARDFLTKPVTVDQITERLTQLRGGDAAPLPVSEFEFIAFDPTTQALLAQLRRVADVPSPVWLEGEIGSGRAHAAQALHRFSGTDGPFTILNVGRDAPWPAAGTVLLPSVDQLPEDLQRRLHRRIQAAPQGLRLVATSAVDGRRLIAEGRLEPELYYALAVVVVQVPALRHRPDDIAPLLNYGLERFGRRYKRAQPTLHAERAEALRRHAWPGNVRELLNLAERAVVMGVDAFALDVVEAPAPGIPKLEPGFSLANHLEGVERRILAEALRKSDGDRAQVGRLLGLERNTLRYKLNKYGLLDK